VAKKSGQKEAPKGPASIHNRRAHYDFEISETYEAGLVLVGSEVKSAYLGRVNLTDAFCRIIKGELWLIQADFEPYKFTTAYQPERRRDRKLLMHRKEIDTIERKSQEKGLSILALGMYFKNGKVKVKLGLGRGKKQYDKREQIKDKETRREQERARSLR